MQRLKISREGIILIKSFEGFRPHAVRRDDGQWVIGYGHTLSAREGGVVSEPDAELLLQFDLIPVAKALNDTAGPLNQHQFDALASFAFSVGLDRFESSDVLARLTSGSTGEAADAIVGWTEPAPTDTPLRRRAAERALFVADPARPVALAELLSAPLPPPAVVMPLFEPEAFDAAPHWTPEPTPEYVPELAAALPAFGPAETTPAEPIAEPAADIANDDASDLADRAEQEAVALAPEPTADDGETISPTSVPEAAEIPEPVAEPILSPSFQAIHRYAAYAPAIVGPLPGGPMPFSAVTTALAASDATASIGAEPNETGEPLSVTTHEAPSPADFTTGLHDPAQAPKAEPNPETVTTAEAESLATGAPSASEPSVDSIAPTPFVASITAQTPSADGGELVVSSPIDETSVFTTQRLVWPHAETSSDQTAPLFEDDGALRLGAHQMIRHEVVAEEPRRIDWRETGLYILMGGFGLLTFGMSMAAFRRASLPSGGSDFTTIAWVLAVFGFACIAVSAWNLYRKLGRPED